MQPSDQKRHIRQALADLVFGLALFAIFVLLGVFGLKQASSEVRPPEAKQDRPATPVYQAPWLSGQHSGANRDHVLSPHAGT